MEKFCLDCGEPITGRMDKKFCSDMCRNNYNNRLNSEVTNYVRNVNNILRKNRRILSELIPQEGKINVHKDKLVNKGFNFNYFTHLYTTQKGSSYRFVYEYGYLPLDNDFYMLVIREQKN
jgi:predicted nucleic acid-binding Zn ribbon protein